jgi:tripartite-type tricarboxylate transporter receptor subunit TctC
MRRKLVIAALTCLCTLGYGMAGASAQPAWPSKPLRFVVPYPAGGNSDLLARLVSQRLGEALGQSVIVDNKGGAGGAIGTAEAARAEPDGYTLLLGDIATHAINPAIMAKMIYKPESLTPVVRLSSVSLLLVVYPKFEAKTVGDLIKLAKAQPGTLNFASSGAGSAQHLAFEYFKSKAGIDMVHVPYKGSAPAMNDLLGGQIPAMIDGTAVPHVKDGLLRALAVTGPKRSPVLPDVPTMQEAGVPGYEYVSWHGMFVPAGTPAPIIERLNTEVNKVLKDPVVRERMAALNIDLVGGTPDEFAAFIRAEAGKVRDIAKASGIQPK